jgi:hypothetical protein
MDVVAAKFLYRKDRRRSATEHQPGQCPTCKQQILTRPAGSILLDAQSLSIHRGSISINFGYIGFAVLKKLLDDWPNATRYDSLADHVWGREDVHDVNNIVNVHVSKIRADALRLGIEIFTGPRGSKSYKVGIHEWPEGRPTLTVVGGRPAKRVGFAPENDPADPWLTPERASHVLGLSVATLSRMRKLEQGPQFHRVGVGVCQGRIFYRSSHLQQWLASHPKRRPYTRRKTS